MELILNKIFLALVCIVGMLMFISSQLSYRDGDFKAAIIQAITSLVVLISAIIAYFVSLWHRIIKIQHLNFI